MSNKLPSPYLAGNIIAATQTAPLTVLSLIAAENPATPDTPEPLRQADVFFLHDAMNHVGNAINGIALAGGVIIATSIADRLITGEDKHPVQIAIAATIISAGINFAYEAGVEIPPYDKKPPEQSLDTPDALYGSFAGALYAGLFCLTALYVRAKKKRQRYIS
ncbi:hypothetical protein H6800_01005 [Candidatus Nomurabacteria bacterium]|nr:hypothetical protein [Candidatus Nomurabacteria bacterium]